jgi:trans-aconitate methyltransferase
MTDFDRFADQYASVLDRALRMSGESSKYFADCKVAHLVRWLGAGYSEAMLDFGCGIGNLALALHSRFPEARIDGYDVSVESLRRVPPALRECGTFTCDLSELQMRYGLVVLSNVLHHVSKTERGPLLRALASRLESGGHIAVFEHNPLNPLTRWVVSQCAFDTGAALLWPAEVSWLFRSAGLRRIRLDYIAFFPRFLAALRKLEPVFGWFPLGAQYCMIGAK